MARTGSSRRGGLALTVLLSLGPARAIQPPGTPKVSQAEYAFLQSWATRQRSCSRLERSVAWNPRRSLGLVLTLAGTTRVGLRRQQQALLAGCATRAAERD
jgi:hypothetical protein